MDDGNKRRWLPLGTVVLLAGASHPAMVTGRLRREARGQRAFEHSGCPWPEGNIAPSGSVPFDGDDICEVLHLGWSPRQEADFVTVLNSQAGRLRSPGACASTGASPAGIGRDSIDDSHAEARGRATDGPARG
jgi:hypothetical protein